MHINEDWFIPEVIDPETEEVLPPGELGELVVTCLGKEALPLVRYRTGDLTRLMYIPLQLPVRKAHSYHNSGYRQTDRPRLYASHHASCVIMQVQEQPASQLWSDIQEMIWISG